MLADGFNQKKHMQAIQFNLEQSEDNNYIIHTNFYNQYQDQ